MSQKPAKTLFQGRYLQLQERSGWEFVQRRHPVVVLIAWTPARELLLVEQYRIPIQQRTIELPAGLVGDHDDSESEDMLTAAARELVEETGWQAEHLRELMQVPTSAGLSSEQVRFVMAEQLTRIGPGGGDDSEDIRVHRVPAPEIDNWLLERYRAGLAIDPKIYAALYWSSAEREPPGADGQSNRQE